MFVDINDRKVAEDALQKTNKKLSMLSNITRHDIKNQADRAFHVPADGKK